MQKERAIWSRSRRCGQRRKTFPVFEDRMVFKPLTKSKPFSTPLFACAEVFWSWVIDTYFVPAPCISLPSAEDMRQNVRNIMITEPYRRWSTKKENIFWTLLEFFRTYPDEKSSDWRLLKLLSDVLWLHPKSWRQITSDTPGNRRRSGNADSDLGFWKAIRITIMKILRLYVTHPGRFWGWHRWSTTNFPPVLCFRITCQGTTTGSVKCKDPSKESLSSRTNTKIFQMKRTQTDGKSATCPHRNLVYIKEHYPEVTASFLKNVSRLKRDLLQKRESFLSEKQKIIRIMQIPMPIGSEKPDTKITMKKRRQLSKNSTAEKEKKYPLILWTAWSIMKYRRS